MIKYNNDMQIGRGSIIYATGIILLSLGISIALSSFGAFFIATGIGLVIYAIMRAVGGDQ